MASQQAMVAELTAAWARVQSLQGENGANVELLQRLQAEFQNYKKRANKERLEFQQKATEGLILKLLDVVDNFERAMRAEGDAKEVLRGVGMIHKQFLYVLEQEGLQSVPCEGAEFDPAIHEAVGKVTNPSLPDRSVVEEISRGYALRDKVLRPARVKVNILDASVLAATAQLEAEMEAGGASAEEALSEAVREALKVASAAKVRRERLRKEEDQAATEALHKREEEEVKFLEELARVTGIPVEELRDGAEPPRPPGGAKDRGAHPEKEAPAPAGGKKKGPTEVSPTELVDDILEEL